LTSATTTSYSQQFINETIEILGQSSIDDVEAVVRTLRETRERGGRVFFCGSGGGAGHASHATCDFRKLAGIECYSVTDNVSELTARINDEGWDGSYAEWLKVSKLRAGDCLFVFSVGGGSYERNISMNLVRAMELAAEVGASIVGIAGRDGGALRKLATASIIVPQVEAANVTAQTEGLQALFWHLVVTHPDLCASTPKWESVTR
jgi:D-sedoheptulose 7-phosphate isomerase